jgi:hypothetical protein
MPLDSLIHNLREIPRFNAAEICSRTVHRAQRTDRTLERFPNERVLCLLVLKTATGQNREFENALAPENAAFSHQGNWDVGKRNNGTSAIHPKAEMLSQHDIGQSRLMHSASIPANVRFSNRPFGVKHLQTIRHHCCVDVAHGLVLLFGIGTKAVPSWDSKTRWNNL